MCRVSVIYVGLRAIEHPISTNRYENGRLIGSVRLRIRRPSQGLFSYSGMKLSRNQKPHVAPLYTGETS